MLQVHGELDIGSAEALRHALDDAEAHADIVRLEAGSGQFWKFDVSPAATVSGGSVSTYNKYNFDGGYYEARILLPTTVGSWPAFWGLYTGWPPEADGSS